VRINGVLGDFKRLSSHNNIVREAKNAVRKQGAKVVLFQFDNETDAIHKQLEVLKMLRIRTYYFFTQHPPHNVFVI
jgi:hypothetical protein